MKRRLKKTWHILKTCNLICGMLYQTTLFGQISPIHENIIPPSPQASDLGKYSEATVNYQTGTPNISIPIYTIKGKDISHNMSLTYDASGRKVGEIAPWTGLGWTLQAGGVITRTVRGLPDEHSDGYFNKYSKWKQVHEPIVLGPNYIPMNETSPENLFLLKCFTNEYDLLPDSYNFNFNGLRGQIMFDGITKEPIVIPHQNLKVERNFYPNGAYVIGSDNWVITAPDGTRYTFSRNDAEITNSNGVAGVFISAWHLSSIENYNRTENISFQYATINNTQGINRYSVKSIGYQKANASTPNECIYPEFPEVPWDELDTYKTKYLTGISYKLNNARLINITLNSTHGTRQDQNSFTPILGNLNYILINSSLDNETLKTIVFGYDYFGTNNKRLKLTSLQEIGKPAYTFEYNKIGKLPDYQSLAIDHWGYYNGAYNTSLIPKTPPGILASGYYLPNSLASANRSSSQQGSLVYLLTKVNYPTGGSATYEFEPHIYKSIETNCVQYISENVTAYSNVSGIHGHGSMNSLETQIRNMFDDGDTQLLGGLPNVRARKFTIGEPQPVTISKTNSGGTFALPTVAFLYKYPLPSQWDQLIPINNSVPVFLSAGEYVLVAMAAEQLEDVWMKMSVDYYIKRETCEKRKVIGGARIKRIVLNDTGEENGGNEITYEFNYDKNYVANYNFRAETNQPHDTIIGNPGFEFVGGNPDTDHQNDNTTVPDQIETIYNPNFFIEGSLKVHYSPRYLETKICNNLVASAYQFDPFAKTTGNHIGYSEVTVIKGGSENGVTVYKFKNGVNPYYRSLPNAEEYYKVNLDADSLIKVKETTYGYNGHHYGASVEGLKVDVIEVGIKGGVQINGIMHYDYFNIYDVSYNNNSKFQYSTSFIGLTKKTESYFVQDDTISTITEFKYDFTKNTELINLGIKINQPTFEIIKTSKSNQSIYKKYNYPHTYLADGSIGRLQNRHVTNYLVSLETGIIDENGIHKKISERLTFPKMQNSLIIKDKVFQFETLEPVVQASTEYSFNRSLENDLFQLKQLADYEYDTQTGNLIGASLRTGVKESYIWSYSSGYLVAKIENASYSDIENAVSNLGATFLSDLVAASSQTIIDTNLSSLRSEVTIDLPNALITTYTYKPGVGITSQTDPNGNSIYYEYDDLGRLIEVKDNEEKVIRKTEYNYSNEN